MEKKDTIARVVGLIVSIYELSEKQSSSRDLRVMVNAEDGKHRAKTELGLIIGEVMKL